MMLTQPGDDAIRQLFVLRPDIVFLNHGSFGACPRSVIETYQAWQWDLERQPIEFLQRRIHTVLLGARERLGLFVGAPIDDIVYVPNTTAALALVTQRFPLQPGDQVLSTTHEYGSMEAAWRQVCERCGASYIRQPLRLPVESAEQVVEDIWSGVTPKTRVLFMSHITAPTALILPVAELVRRAKERGIITVIDGAHVPGQLPLNLEQLGADIYVASCHKWMMGPKGTGFLYVRREAQPLLWGAMQGNQPEGRTHTLLDLEWQGTYDITAYLAIPAAIRFMEENNWPQIQVGCHELLRYARQRILELTGLPSLTPDSAEWFAQMGPIPIPPCDERWLKNNLYEMFKIEIPVISFEGQQHVRLSVQGYNSRADIDKLIEALARLLPIAPPAVSR